MPPSAPGPGGSLSAGGGRQVLRRDCRPERRGLACLQGIHGCSPPLACSKGSRVGRVVLREYFAGRIARSLFLVLLACIVVLSKQVLVTVSLGVEVVYLPW